MELNRQIYKIENDTQGTEVIFNQKSLTTVDTATQTYTYQQDINKMPDISFCYGMAKGVYSPTCRLYNVAVHRNVNASETKTKVTAFNQKFCYMFLTDRNFNVNNSEYPVGLFGDTNVQHFDGTSDIGYAWGKGVTENYYHANTFSSFLPAIKFKYNSAYVSIISIYCYKTIDDALTSINEKVIHNLTDFDSNYPYINEIRLAFYYGKSDTLFRGYSIHNDKVKTYKSGGLTNVDIVEDNIAVSDVSFVNLWALGGNNWGTIRYHADYTNTHNFFFWSPKPFEVLQHSTNNLVFGTICTINEVNELKKMISTYGLIWCDDKNFLVDELTPETYNEHYYIPVRNSEGFYTGEYVQGEKAKEYLQNHPEIATNDGWQATNGVNNNPDTHDYTDKIDLNKPTLSTIGVFNRSYAMNFNDILELSNYIWNDDDNVFNQIVEGLKLFGENPINALISLRLYPFDIDNKLGSTSVEKIKLGRIVTDIEGKTLPNNIDCIFDLGETEFPNYHDNFLDYSPYTECELVIPYCGNLTIQPQEFIGKILSIKLVVDFNLGACTAVVFADGIPKLYKSGNIGAEIAMSSNISADYGKNWLNASVGAVSNISSIASGNIVSAVSTVTDLATSATQPTIIQNVGGNSSVVNNWLPQQAYLIIRTSESKEPANYGATVGYACSFEEKLSNLSGYTVVSNPQITFKCTSAENEEIKRILQNGFYI